MGFPFVWWGASRLEDPLAAADAGYTRTHRFKNRGSVERFQESIELLGGAGELDRVGLVGDVDDSSAKDVRGALDFLAILAGGAHLDEHELPLDVLALGKVDDLDHVDELIQLLGDLLDHVVGAGGDDRHARKRLVLGRSDREGLDVVAARGEKARDSRKRTCFVLHARAADRSRYAPALL